MKLSGKYELRITGDTRDLVPAGGRNTAIIGHVMQRLLTGQEAAADSELAYWNITIDDGYVTPPRYPDSVQLEPTPEMIEAGWGVLDRAGIEAPEVEVMCALWAAMEGAR